MGIKGLPQFLKQYFSDLFVPISEADILRSRIAIDTGVFMHRFTVNMHYPDEYIARFLQFAQMLRNLSADFIFIFDGKPCSAKGNALKSRRDKRARNLLFLQQKIKALETEEQQVFRVLVQQSTSTEKDGDSRTIAKLLANLQHLRSKRMLLLSRTIPINRGFFYRLQSIFARDNIPYLEADGEAEKACAWLADTGIVDLVVTEDYDALVCGAPRVLRYWHHHDRYCIPSVISLAPVLERLRLTYQQFVTVCVLAGSDFAQSPPYFGFRKALAFVTSNTSNTTVRDIFDANYRHYYGSSDVADDARKAFEQAHLIFANTKFPFLRNLLGIVVATGIAAILRVAISLNKT